MNYHAPREIIGADGKGTGKYHYTCANSGGVYAEGYCSPWQTCAMCEGHAGPGEHSMQCRVCENRGVVKKDQPCPGHETPEAACEHQRQYYLDHARYFPDDAEILSRVETLHKCAICRMWTAGYAQWGPGMMPLVWLCDDHCNRESLEKLVKVGVTIES